MVTGLELIAQKRRSHIYDSGHTVETDIIHAKGELMEMAMCMMAIGAARLGTINDEEITKFLTENWPFKGKLPKTIFANAAEAYAEMGALIAAEIDRLLLAKIVTEPKDKDFEDDGN